MAMIHATCIAIDGHGILIRGPSGSGKSDLALRLIDTGAELVSDDYVNVFTYDNKLIAKTPENISGKIEVRELGIVSLSYRKEVSLTLVVNLTTRTDSQRLKGMGVFEIEGTQLPAIELNAFRPSAPAMIRIGLECAIGKSTIEP